MHNLLHLARSKGMQTVSLTWDGNYKGIDDWILSLKQSQNCLLYTSAALIGCSGANLSLAQVIQNTAAELGISLSAKHHLSGECPAENAF